MGVILNLINFINKQKPAVSAQNLNQMQTNIQTAITELEGNIEDTYQEKLTTGDNITIENGVISATGGGTQFLTQEISKSITAAGYATASSNMGTLTIPEGYTFVGFLTKFGASGLVVSYHLEGTAVKLSYHNGTNAEIKTTVTAVAFFIKN
jgi:hypothetical protein